MAEEKAVEYVEVSIEEFISGRQIPFDIYIRLSQTKYLRLAAKGEDLSPDRLSKYKDKNIKLLYLKRDDYLKYVGMQAVPHAPTLEPAAAAEAKHLSDLCHLGDLTLDIIFTNEMNDIVYGTAKSFVDTTISLLTEGRHAFGVLAPLGEIADFVYAHGVAVSAYSVVIARALGWKSSPNIFKLAMGGLLHDIGKRDIPRELLLKPKSKLKPAELALLQEHPVRGVKILETLPAVPSDVIDIVLQHHENMHGSGYPNKHSAVHIHPMAKIVGTANAFCDLVLRGVDGPALKPFEAVARLEKTGEYDPESVQALKKLFKP